MIRYKCNGMSNDWNLGSLAAQQMQMQMQILAVIGAAPVSVGFVKYSWQAEGQLKSTLSMT